ncbi:hypothetical protein SCHPADRAFT_994021 [Schizopora paradoxa]|uniref:Uncharacterized protein n=1 Tax=Schizopora paradoxa TaxID=27342 RepID=A0A0H2S858_9AGAM|nr:hypothetical protein SCHPADRAFT_994021 [Schizopora paradoxa]
MAVKSKSSSLDPNECFAEIWHTKVRFDNPSEALLAQLFLKDKGAIPLSAFNALLSVIRNPSFDTREIKFKDIGDFCSKVVSSRDGAVTRRGWASNTGIPEVILEGALDVFGEELRGVWDDARRYYHGNVLSEGRQYEEAEYSSLDDALATWRHTLLNCALVHSSWLVRARPLRGYYHRLYASDRSPLTRSLTNPSLGSWTRDLQMKLEERSPFLHGNMINALLCRVPNLRTFQLHILHYVPKIHNVFVAKLCKSLSSFTSLEEVCFSTLVLEKSKQFVQRLSQTPPPNLKVIQLLGGRSLDFASHLPQWLSPLLSIASLQSIGVHHGGERRFINGFTWSRSLANSNRFELDELSIWAKNATSNLEDSVLEALRLTKRLNFKYRGGQATVGRILSECPSLRSLSLIGDSWEIEFFDLAEVLPNSVEELNILFPPFTESIDDSNSDSDSEEDFTFLTHSARSSSAEEVASKLGVLDLYIHKALHSGKTSHLRSVNIYIHRDTVSQHRNLFHSPNHRLLYRKGVENSELVGAGEPSSRFIKAPVLPLCQLICRERGVLFSVEVQLLKMEMD